MWIDKAEGRTWFLWAAERIRVNPAAPAPTHTSTAWCSISSRSSSIERGLSASDLFEDVVCLGGPYEGLWVLVVGDDVVADAVMSCSRRSTSRPSGSSGFR